MLALIFLTMCNLCLIGVALQSVLTIRRDMSEFFEHNLYKQLGILNRVLEQLLTKEDMQKHLDELQKKVAEIDRASQKMERDRWAKMKAALGGKPVEED